MNFLVVALFSRRENAGGDEEIEFNIGLVNA